MENEARIEKLVETVVEDLENMGLYSRQVAIMGGSTADDEEGEDEEFDLDSKDIRKLIADGEASYAIVGVWQIGKVAWQDKILNPEKYDEDRQFKAMMPTEQELLANKVQEALQSGVDIFDIDLELGVFNEDESGT